MQTMASDLSSLFIRRGQDKEPDHQDHSQGLPVPDQGQGGWPFFVDNVFFRKIYISMVQLLLVVGQSAFEVSSKIYTTNSNSSGYRFFICVKPHMSSSSTPL